MVSYLMPSTRRSPFLPIGSFRGPSLAKWARLLPKLRSIETHYLLYRPGPPLLRSKMVFGQKKALPRKRSLSCLFECKTKETPALYSTLGISPSPQQTRKRKRRRKYTYDSNLTIARKVEAQIEYGKQKDDLSRADCLLQNPALQDMAQDHIYRRVQLFYYLCVIYYRTGCLVELAPTTCQHGSSRISGFSAAHSSILTNLKDNFFQNLKIISKKVGLDRENRELLFAIGVEEEKLNELPFGPLTEFEFEELLAGIDQESLIGDHCHFFHNLNSTVELPHCVNEFDTVIEDFMRAKSLEILNSVAKEGIHPYKALAVFVCELQSFLEKCEQATEAKIELLEEMESLEQDLWNMQERFSKNVFSKFLETIQAIGKCFAKLHDLRPYSLATNLKGRLTWQKNYFSQDTKLNEKNFRRIQAFVKTEPMPYPAPATTFTEPLSLSLKVIQLQKKYSLMPERALLSGKMVDKRLIPLSEEELISQKLSLIRRG